MLRIVKFVGEFRLFSGCRNTARCKAAGFSSKSMSRSGDGPHQFGLVIEGPLRRNYYLRWILPAFAAVSAVGAASICQTEGSRERIFNWSNTESCCPQKLLRPDSEEEVEIIIKDARNGAKLRIMGSGLSPNGIGFSDDQVLCLENMNQVLSVDMEKMQVTVQAGMLVGDLLDELAQHGLTLQNLASINQQQVGGFLQVGAHGTGASLPPVEEQIVSMTVVSPGLGTIELSKDSYPQWFQMAKCGLGCFGVVTKAVLQCVPAHKLCNRIEVVKRNHIREGHVERLQRNRHVRYMWIPYTDSVVVVTSNPIENEMEVENLRKENTATKPLVDLLKKIGSDMVNLEGRSFGELRDMLIQKNPLSKKHIEQVNKAELEFWQNSQAVTVDDSQNILGFDCGGQQFVLEAALPCGTQLKPNGSDIDFMENLLDKIESTPSLAAPAPIEQRWTCGSTAALSPASSSLGKNGLFSWVGIIMYCPMQDPELRKDVEEKFKEYRKLLNQVGESGGFDLRFHWAKLVVPSYGEDLRSLRLKLKGQFPIDSWNSTRKVFDPQNSLTNNIVEALLL